MCIDVLPAGVYLQGIEEDIGSCGTRLEQGCKPPWDC